GGDGDDTLNGQGGTDVIAGNEGTDTIVDGPAETNEAFTFPASVLAALDTL
ncbi:MAG: calcium-binding protein, partial [Planctomycetaceae bacterium]|nr:calcium-binding protein [Planctomycetaceae bacterium]